jgi:hypothetical protein
MSEFSNSFFRDLPPRDRRYDVPVGEQLVFCVFPNGVKTWVHVYPFEEFTRRRTIGLYPDMRYEQVQEALAASRRIIELDTDHEKRRIKEVHRNRGLRNFGMTVVATATGVAVSVLVAKNLQGDVAPLSEAPTTTLEAPVPDAEYSGTGPATLETAEESTDMTEPVTPEAQPGMPTVAVAPLDTSTTDEQQAAAVESDLEILRPDEIEMAAAISADLTLAQADQAEATNDDAIEVTGDTGDGNPVTGGDQEDDLVQPEMPVSETDTELLEPVTATSTTTDPSVDSDNVRRAILAEGVEDHEPTVVLESLVPIGHGMIRSLFFFTELRGLGGERIRHRWNYLDNTLAEVPFDVQADGRWRVYSSKQVSSDQTGRWTVEVVAADGSVLSTLSFEVEQTDVD